MSKIIEFNNIQRSFQRGVTVLDSVSFSVEQGEVLGLLGRNGAGKTTLVRIAMGLLAPQAGQVRVLGLDPRRKPLEVKRQVGYVAEEQVLPDFLRVKEVIQLHRKLFPTWDRAFEEQLLDQFRISHNAKIKTLSKGQARQVALVCAMSHRPPLLLLDEPGGGLDPAVRREFLETSIRYLADSGSSILFSSHYMGDVERMANRVVMLEDGRVLIDSDLDQLHEQYSLALIPHDSGATPERLLALDGCLAVRDRVDSLHAILQLEPDSSIKLLRDSLGVSAARCQPIPLEEIFIEVMGGQR